MKEWIKPEVRIAEFSAAMFESPLSADPCACACSASAGAGAGAGPGGG